MDFVENSTSSATTGLGSSILETRAALPYQDVLDRIFIASLVGLVIVANVLMGCELDLNIVLNTLKRPVAPAIGFFTQFAIMPLLAYSIALLVLSSSGEHLLALGLFVTGCSPGGGASNYWTILLGGNVNLSITMTFLSTIGALVMMPLWIRVLGARLVQAVSPTASVLIPYGKIVASLVTLILPLLAGLLIARFRPNLAIRARKMMRPFIIGILVFIIGFAVFINWWLLKLITWRILWAGMLLPWCGFMFGCFSSIILAQRPPDVTAIAIETGVQNTGIAIMLLKLSFPGTDSDIASLLPIVVACFTPGPLLLGYAIHSTIKRLRMRRAAGSGGDGLNSRAASSANASSTLPLNNTAAESELNCCDEECEEEEEAEDNTGERWVEVRIDSGSRKQ